MKLTPLQIRGYINRFLNESYEQSKLVNKRAQDIDSVTTYTASGAMASKIINAINDNTTNFGQIFEAIMAAIMAKDSNIPIVSSGDINPDTSDKDQKGNNAEFADIIARDSTNNSTATSQMTLSDLQNSYLISAKSVKGPFEFTGKGKPSKLIKLLDRLLKSDEKIKEMPRGGINLKAAACYAALDPKNSADLFRPVYDVQLALPAKHNIRIMPPGTKLKIGLNVNDDGFKERGIGQIKDASSSVIRTNRKGPAPNSYITTLLELFKYAADDDPMGIPYDATTPSGGPPQKNYVKKISELFDADPDSGDHLKVNTGWMYSLRTKAPPARYNDLVNKWGELVKSGKSLGDIYDDLINSATDNIFAAIEKHQEGAKARMEVIQKSPEGPNVKANAMVDLMYSRTWKTLPDEYTLELADKDTIENLLKARSVLRQRKKPQAYEVETPSRKRYVYTFESDFVSKMSKKFSVKMTKDLIKKKLKAKFPKEKTGLGDIGWHANYYLGNIAQANQFTDLSSAALTPDALNVDVDTPNGSETIASAIADNQTVLSTYTLDSDGQPVGKVEEAGNFSTFITQFMISGYNYYYFKIVLDVDPTNSNPESDNGLYARALQGLLGTGVARMTSSGSKASEAVPRRQYSQYIQKSPRSFNLNDMKLYEDEVQKQFNAIAQVVLDKSRLNELSEALTMAATPDAVGYDPNRITDLVTKIQDETKRLNKAHNQLYGSKSSNESQRSKVALISERIYSNMFDGGFDYADVIQSAEQSSIVKYRASFLEYLHHLLLNLILLSGDQNQVNSLADDQVVFLKSLNIDQVSAPDSGEQEATQASPDAPSNDDLFVDDALAQYDPKVASQNPVLQERKSLSAVDEYKKLLYNSRRRR